MIRFLCVLFLIAAPSFAAEPPPLAGSTWKTKFVASNDGVQVQHTVVFLSASEMKETARILINHPLFKGAMRVDMEETYQIGPASTQVPGAFDINIQFKKFWQTPLDDATTRQFIKNKECGYTNWETGVPLDATGRGCLGEPGKEPTERYDIFKQDGDSLYFGFFPEDDDNMGTTPDQRPKTLDPAKLFVRQP